MLDMQRSRLQVAGILHYFSDLFVSDDIGAEKPSEAFFEEAMRRSGVAPNEVLFIGDSLQADMTAPFAVVSTAAGTIATQLQYPRASP